jgi:hypothetical protein
MTEEMVSVIDAARELGRGKTTLFKIMKRLGISGSKQRDPSKGNQVVTLITRTELDRIRSDLRPANRGNEQTAADTFCKELGRAVGTADDFAMLSAVPTGRIGNVVLPVPSDKSLGYYQTSLPGRNLATFVSLHRQ